MTDATPISSWTCGTCALDQDVPYRPPLSPDARCRVCGEPPPSCDMIRFDLASLRHRVEELNVRLLRAEPRREPEPEDLMTAAEAAAFLRLPSVRALYQLVRRGRVEAHRLGRQLRFSRSELAALVRQG
jgi:excisionase family DNA binding protein